MNYIPEGKQRLDIMKRMVKSLIYIDFDGINLILNRKYSDINHIRPINDLLMTK